MTAEERKAARRKGKQVLTLPFEPLEGIHDVYFVFKNPTAMDKQVMMTITELEFYNKGKELE